MKKLIELCPDAQYEGKQYSADCEAKTPSILQCFYSCKFFDYLKQFQNKETSNALKIFITGPASIGKSTAIEAIRIELIKLGLTFAFVNLRRVDSDNIDNTVKTLKERDIIVFDAYDELEEKFQSTIDSFIRDKNKSIIISSRHEKYVKTKDIRVSIFDEYKKIYLKELSQFQINRVLNKKGIKKTDNEKLYNLLQNTMFLSIFLTINEVNKDGEIANIDSEYALMELYFKELYKLKTENRADTQASWKSTLLSAGEMTYNYMLSSSKKIAFFENDEFNNIILKDIISRDSNGSLVYAHQTFADFLVAYYLNKEISLYENLEKLRFSTSPIWNGALYMLGQSLQADKATEVLFSSVKSKDKYVYKNILLTYLGINNGVLDDKWNLIDRKFIRFAQELHFFRDNRQIKEINTKHFKTIKGIDIDDFYHCSKVKLVLSKSAIHRFDFANMFCLDRLKLCSGVKKIGSFAFLNCENLTTIEISDTLKRIDPYAFFKCINLYDTFVNNENSETDYFIVENGNIISQKSKTIVLLCDDFYNDNSAAVGLQRGAIDGFRLSKRDKIRLPKSINQLPTSNMFDYSTLYALKEEKKEFVLASYIKSKPLTLLVMSGLGVVGKVQNPCFGEGMDIIAQGDNLYIQNSWQSQYKVDKSQLGLDSMYSCTFYQKRPRSIAAISSIDAEQIKVYEQEKNKKVRHWLWLYDKTCGVMEYKWGKIGCLNKTSLIYSIMIMIFTYIAFAVFGIIWATTPIIPQLFSAITSATNGFLAVILIYLIACILIVSPLCFVAKKLSELIYCSCFKKIRALQLWLYDNEQIDSLSIFKV